MERHLFLLLTCLILGQICQVEGNTTMDTDEDYADDDYDIADPCDNADEECIWRKKRHTAFSVVMKDNSNVPVEFLSRMMSSKRFWKLERHGCYARKALKDIHDRQVSGKGVNAIDDIFKNWLEARHCIWQRHGVCYGEDRRDNDWEIKFSPVYKKGRKFSHYTASCNVKNNKNSKCSQKSCEVNKIFARRVVDAANDHPGSFPVNVARGRQCRVHHSPVNGYRVCTGSHPDYFLQLKRSPKSSSRSPKSSSRSRSSKSSKKSPPPKPSSSSSSPPATKPPVTKPPGTKPWATKPPATKPWATKPPATKAPATKAPGPAPVKECSGAKSDIVIIVDGSGSVAPSSYVKTMNFVQDFVDDLDLDSHGELISRVSLLQYSNSVITYTVYSNKRAELNTAITKMRGDQLRGGTSSWLALDKAHELMTSYGRKGVAQNILFMTDGQSWSQQKTIESGNKLHNASMGPKVFAMGIGSNLNIVELKAVASDPDSKYYYGLNNFDALSAVKAGIVTEMCTRSQKYRSNGDGKIRDVPRSAFAPVVGDKTKEGETE